MSRIIVDSIRNSSASSDGITLSSDGKVAFPNTSTGKILQVKTNTTRDSTGSVHCNPANTYVDITDQNVTITPSAATSKIKISFHQFGETGSSPHQYMLAIKRAISGGATTTIEGTAAGNRATGLTMLTDNYNSDYDSTPEVAQISNYLDSPNTTSAVTYTVQIKNVESTQYYYYNRAVSNTDNAARERGLSWITVEEVAA
jgi:hypothetical protein